jgi:hypothetical protein
MAFKVSRSWSRLDTVLRLNQRAFRSDCITPGKSKSEAAHIWDFIISKVGDPWQNTRIGINSIEL